METPKQTVDGNPFLVPEKWTVQQRGDLTLLTAPEPGSFVAVVNVNAVDAEQARDKAWALYDAKAKREVLAAHDGADRNGWSKVRAWDYRTAPNEKRSVLAQALFAHGAGRSSSSTPPTR